MAATSRWVRFPVAGTTSFIGTEQSGYRGLQRGTALTADSVTIPGSSENQLKINVDSAAGPAPYQITLTSGTSLDPRFIARDIQRKVQAAGAGINDGFDYCQVEWVNWKSSNGFGQFLVRSGSTGASSAVAITAGDSSVLTRLGMNTLATEGGTVNHIGTSTAAVNAAYTGSVTVSGTYRGAFDDTYKVFIAPDQLLVATTYGGANTYGVANAGVASSGGFWNADATDTYTVTVDTTNGSVSGGGTGFVPTFTVTSSQSDNEATPQEILYPDEHYYIGTKGLTLSFSDAVFGDGDVMTVVCTVPTTVDGSNATGAVATAEYVYRSTLRDDSTIGTSTVTSTGGTALGRKGLTISWTDSGVLTPRDEWTVVCKGPTPEQYGVTNVSYGNVTVTTESPVKVHQFEIISGAVDMSSVKFSLQNHGTFSHHDAGDLDTYFRYGTAGFGNPGDGTAANNGPEWTTGVSASDLATAKTSGNTGAPVALDSTIVDLSVVASADNAEDVGNRSLVSDFIWTNIRLGAQESGANSTVNYRLYFDYN